MARSIHLTDRVQFVKGVGPDRVSLFKRLGVETVEDLLFLFPREYTDLRQVTPIRSLVEDATVVIVGRVVWFDFRMTRSGVPIVEIQCADATGELTATWFHRPDLRETIIVGSEVQLTGKAKRVDGHWKMINPKIRAVADGAAAVGMVPVYPLTEGLKPHELRSMVQYALAALDDAGDPLPETWRKRRDLFGWADALRALHQPSDDVTLVRARQRLVYDEFLTFQLAIAMKRASRRKQRGIPIRVSEEVDRRIRRLFPFSLTPGQERALGELVADLSRPVPMHRMLQGDAGSGKTALAIYAALAVIAAGHQVAMMAPTEVLARQQIDVINRYLAHSRVRRRVLTGSISADERAETLEGLACGQVDLVIGTQALLQPSVQFHRLALVVIDEQHKFGVRQRAELMKQEITPHQLVMTATPIPRSLAITWFGDLDLSTIADKPAGRVPVKTHLVPASRRDEAYAYIARQARRGFSSLIVCSRIDSTGGLRGAEQVYSELREGPFADLEVELVHGRLPENDRVEAIRRFRRGDAPILVATVVIEVGLDVPAASIVLIENADRFGLSQLHQIRGRVGRSEQPGTCLLLSDAEDPDAIDRLNRLTDTSDGFKIAEADAQLRGVGDPLGDRQHGHLRLRVGDFIQDAEILGWAREDAEAIIRQDPNLSAREWAHLRASILERYARTLGIALVG